MRGVRTLVWFRSDLRVRDNTGLHHAAKASDQGVVGAYVVSPEEWRSHDTAACRVEFILRTLRVLSEDLRGLSIPLVILNADTAREVPPLLLDFARRAGCDALCFNREYEWDESHRDSSVTAAFERAGLTVRSFDDQVILAPHDVRTGDGRFFTVFTPYRRAWFARLSYVGGAPVLPPSPPQPDSGIAPSPVPESVPGFRSTIDPALWPAGEREAAALLERFVAERIARYRSDRDFPAADGTSTLSPYLSCGAISARQCLAAAIEANGGKVNAGKMGPDTWVSELVWREFYLHILVGYPRVCMSRAFKPGTERLEWRDDEAGFGAWCEGRTGYPIVDAAMRQLLATGWMHNRLRMIVAMFLTKDLFIDWRRGERHFMRNLIDGFFASNNGGWQWSASTGTDAAPYFRIFNPTSQSKAHDPGGDFIRRYVPELASLGPGEIHDPSAEARRRLGYPERIVDHPQARERVMGAFQALKTPP